MQPRLDTFDIGLPLKMRRYRALAARPRKTLSQPRHIAIRRQIKAQGRRALRQDLIAKRGGYRIDHPAFYAGFCDDKLSRMPGFDTGMTPHHDGHRFDRMPGKLHPEMPAPAHHEATVRRLQRSAPNPTLRPQPTP